MMFQTLEMLIQSSNESVSRLATLIKSIKQAVEAKSITQSECDELMEDMENAKMLVDRCISLNLKIEIINQVLLLYQTILTARSLLPT